MKFRHPKTHSEKAASADPECRGLVRAKRRVKNLASDWDDRLESTGRKPRKRWTRKTQA